MASAAPYTGVKGSSHGLRILIAQPPISHAVMRATPVLFSRSPPPAPQTPPAPVPRAPLHRPYRATEQSMSQAVPQEQQFESHRSLASLPPRRENFQTRDPSPQAPQTAPAPA